MLHLANFWVNLLDVTSPWCPHVSREQPCLWVENRTVLWFSMDSCLGSQFSVFLNLKSLGLKYPSPSPFAPERVTQWGREEWSLEFFSHLLLPDGLAWTGCFCFMRHLCKFAALPARWREAKAASNPQRHPGQGRANKSQFRKLLSGTVLLSIYRCGQRWQKPCHMAPSQGCWSSSGPQPLGCSTLPPLAKVDKFSLRILSLAGKVPKPSCCREGRGFLFFRLEIQPHA